MSAAVSHQSGWMRYPAITNTANNATIAGARKLQRRGAIVSKIARTAFRHNRKRQGNCTKRSLGKCCQRKSVIESMANAARPPQAESNIHVLRCRDRHARENQIATARAAISDAATVETSRLKRLCSESATVVKKKLSCGRTPGARTSPMFTQLSSYAAGIR